MNEDSGRRRKLHAWLIPSVFAALVLLYVGGLGAAYLLQERLIFPAAYMRHVLPVEPPDREITRVWCEGEDGRVEAWFRAGAGRSEASPGPAVIYFHGNGDVIDTRWSVGKLYTEHGISFLAVEYAGYGRSGGSPSQARLVADSTWFYDWLAARPEVDRTKIVFHGLSLGGGVAVATAEHRKPAAIVLECTFESMVAQANRYFVPGFLCKHPFRTDLVLPKLGVPVLIFHGCGDTLIPISQARRLHALTPGSEFVELDCAHHTWQTDCARIERFLGERGFLAGR